jgi:hypothetical protein
MMKLITFNMKKILFFILAGCFVACSDNGDPAPVTPPVPQLVAPALTVEGDYETPFQGVIGSPTSSALIRKVKAFAPEGFKELRIDKYVDGQLFSYEGVSSDQANSDTGHEYTLNYILNANDVGKEVFFRATLIDMENAETFLDFATIETFQPMVSSGVITLATDMPPDGNVQRNYFLYVQENNIKPMDMAEMVSDQLSADVVAVLSANDGNGIYLGSPNALVEENLVVKIPQKRKTKFKEIVLDAMELNSINIYDLFKVEKLHSEAEFGSHEERANQLDEEKAFTFMTDEGRTGIIIIKGFSFNNGEYLVKMQVFISQ